jgi:uncharacterized membrane protein
MSVLYQQQSWRASIYLLRELKSNNLNWHMVVKQKMFLVHIVPASMLLLPCSTKVPTVHVVNMYSNARHDMGVSVYDIRVLSEARTA